MYTRYTRSDGFWDGDRKTPPMPSFAARRGDTPAPAETRHEAAVNRNIAGGLKNIFKGLDLGDILLIAIIVFLLMESDDIEVALALGLVLLGGL